MNRAQRRALFRQSNKKQKIFYDKPEPTEDFSNVPNVTLCQSIMLLINELRSRGYPLVDFDDKTRTLQQINILGDTIYFLAAPENPTVEEGTDEKKEKDDNF